MADVVRYATSVFAKADLCFGHGTATPGDEAHALVMQTLALPFDPPPYVYTAALTAAERATLGAHIQRRVSGREPLAYITGEAFFCGLPFAVDPRVLIPRSPIGELIADRFDAYAALPPGARVLDMCTGSGCIAVALAVWHDDVIVDAVDLSTDALTVAATNVRRHNVGDRVSLVRSDGFTALQRDRTYDLIVANPPYVPASSMAALPAEYAHEPASALVAGTDGLDLVRQLLADAPAYLSDGGVLIMEVGEAADAFAGAFADLPVIWCDFEHGGDGVLAVEASALAAAAN